MKKPTIFLVAAVLVGGAIYAQVTYPAGCAKLEADAGRDTTAIFHAGGSSGEGKTGTVLAGVGKLLSDTVGDLANLSGSAKGLGAEGAAGGGVFKAPTTFPAKPGWTWTTLSGEVFHDVRVVGMEQNSVTIVFPGGGRQIPVSNLPASLQTELGYDPAQFASSAPEQQTDAAAQAPTLSGWQTDNYNLGLQQTQARRKQVLLLFTGSDWCPTCKQLESQILPTAGFQSFASGGYIMVTLELTHDGTSSDPKIQQNQKLAGRYQVHGVPTLIVTDANGSEIRRAEGCPASTDALISMLTGTHHEEQTSNRGLPFDVVIPDHM